MQSSGQLAGSAAAADPVAWLCPALVAIDLIAWANVARVLAQTLA